MTARWNHTYVVTNIGVTFVVKLEYAEDWVEEGEDLGHMDTPWTSSYPKKPGSMSAAKKKELWAALSGLQLGHGIYGVKVFEWVCRGMQN
jgi:hypothetical protein